MLCNKIHSFHPQVKMPHRHLSNMNSQWPQSTHGNDSSWYQTSPAQTTYTSYQSSPYGNDARNAYQSSTYHYSTYNTHCNVRATAGAGVQFIADKCSYQDPSYQSSSTVAVPPIGEFDPSVFRSNHTNGTTSRPWINSGIADPKSPTPQPQPSPHSPQSPKNEVLEPSTAPSP